MAKTPAIQIEHIELDGEARLWDVMRAALQAKEAQPQASPLPAMLILKSNGIVAKVYEGRAGQFSGPMWNRNEVYRKPSKIPN